MSRIASTEFRGLAIKPDRRRAVFRGEEVRLEHNAVRSELVVEVRLEAGARQRGQQPRSSTLCRLRLVGRLRDEDVLQRDRLRLHPKDFGDVGDPARTVDKANDLNEQVESG